MTYNPKTMINESAKIESIAASGSFSQPTSSRSIYLVTSTGGAVTSSTTPFGSVAPVYDGTVITLIGNDNTNTVKIPHADVAKGCLLNGDCVLYKGSILRLVYNATMDRYIDDGRNQYGIS